MTCSGHVTRNSQLIIPGDLIVNMMSASDEVTSNVVVVICYKSNAVKHSVVSLLFSTFPEIMWRLGMQIIEQVCLNYS